MLLPSASSRCSPGGRGPGCVHPALLRTVCQLLGSNQLRALSDTALSQCCHGIARPLGHHWSCLPGSSAPGCSGAARRLRSRREVHDLRWGVRPRPNATLLGPQFQRRTGALRGKARAGRMHFLQSSRPCKTTGGTWCAVPVF